MKPHVREREGESEREREREKGGRRDKRKGRGTEAGGRRQWPLYDRVFANWWLVRENPYMREGQRVEECNNKGFISTDKGVLV
jgi:hypothetical protein